MCNRLINLYLMRLIIYDMKNYEYPGGTGKLLNCKSQADWPFTIINLTNRFHVAVRLSSNRSQMTPKVVKTKKWHTSRGRVCHLMRSLVRCRN